MGAAGRGSLVAVGVAVGDADGAVGTGPPEPQAASPRASPARVRAGATRLMKASKRLQARIPPSGPEAAGARARRTRGRGGCEPARAARQWATVSPSGHPPCGHRGVRPSPRPAWRCSPRRAPSPRAPGPLSASASSPRRRTSPTGCSRSTATLLARLRERLAPAGRRRGRARDRAGPRRPVAAARPRRGGASSSRPSSRPSSCRSAAAASTPRSWWCAAASASTAASSSPGRRGPIRDLADLRGRTLVLQALRSTSAFALPKAELERAGLRLVPADDPRAGPAARPLRARARRDQPGGLGAAREGRRRARSTRATGRPCRRGSARSCASSTRPGRSSVDCSSFRAGLAPRVRRLAEEALLGLDDDEPGRDALALAAGITRFEPLTAGDRQGLRGWARGAAPAPR